MMTVLDFWELMQNDPIKKHNEIKESKKMVLIDRDELIEKFRNAANYHKKAVNNKTTVGIDLAMHKAQWKAFEDAIFQCKNCKEQVFTEATEEMPAKPEKEASKTLNKVTITRTGSNEIAFELNGKPVGWSQLITSLLPGTPCTFAEFCSREIKLKQQQQLTPCKTKINFTDIEFSKELDLFNSTPHEIEQGFKERIYRITKWIEEHKVSVIEFEV